MTTVTPEASKPEGAAQSVVRELPVSIEIPSICGEMVFLRPAQIEDLPVMDTLNAYINASSITGKDRKAERAAVHAWVHRSVAWSRGIATDDSGVGDPEARRTIAWTVMKVPDGQEKQLENTPQNATQIIGMIFLIDIDGWAKSARIQVVLGNEYRGRGYSRDAMPRVLTYGFAQPPEGLQMHRIWVAVPEKNTRSRSVYQSLGFVPSGTSRDALWDNRNQKYQDLIVMDTLADEYDPVRSLDAFGMHVISGNPGVTQALAAHEHSLAIRQKETQAALGIGEQIRDDRERIATDDIDSENTWPYNTAERNTSKKAWWRNLGRDRMEQRVHAKEENNRGQE